MAIPTVQDLVDELDAYGGHLPVKLLLPGAREDKVLPLVISDQVIDGETTVVLIPEPEQV